MSVIRRRCTCTMCRANANYLCRLPVSCVTDKSCRLSPPLTPDKTKEDLVAFQNSARSTPRGNLWGLWMENFSRILYSISNDSFEEWSVFGTSFQIWCVSKGWLADYWNYWISGFVESLNFLRGKLEEERDGYFSCDFRNIFCARIFYFWEGKGYLWIGYAN